MFLNEEKRERILIVVILIFAFLSAIATMIGAASILETENSILRYGFASLIAVGLSLFLIYLTLQLSYSSNIKKIWPLAFTYIFIAMLSLVFNFSAFIGWSLSEEYLVNDVNILHQNITNLSARSNDCFDSVYKYTEKIKEVEQLILDMKTEETRRDRPGRKWRYYDIETKYNIAKVELDRATEKFNNDKLFVEKRSTEIKNILENAMTEKQNADLKSAIEKGIRAENEILAYIKARSPKFIHKKFSSQGLYLENPNFALITIQKLFTSLGKEDIFFTKNEKSAIILSFFFGFLLDFPIFLTLVVLRLGRSKTQQNFQDLFNRRSTKQINKKGIF